MGESTRREFAAQLGAVAAGVALAEAGAPRRTEASLAGSELSMDVTGLCGIVLDRPRGRAEVLLVDPVAMGTNIPKHIPVLAAPLNDVMNPVADSNPTTVVAIPSPSGHGVDQIGIWDLTDKQVLIRRPGGAEAAAGLKFRMSENSEQPGLPKDVNDPEAWRDLRYVPSMEQITGDGRIAPVYLSEKNGELRNDVPRGLAARVRFAEGLLEGAIPSHAVHRGLVYEFAVRNGHRTYSQPATDTVRWSLCFEKVDDGNYIAVDIVPLRGASSNATRSLLIARRGQASRLSISNLPVADPSHAHGAMNEQIGALHFGAFYKLLRNQPADDALPELRRLERDRKGAGFMAELPCFSARFTRE